MTPRMLLMGLVLVAAPALAQSGAVWVDGYGRTMELGFTGGGAALPSAAPRTAQVMATAFKQLCVDTDTAPQSIAAIAQTQGLSASPLDLPGSKKVAAVTLDVWTGPGIVISRSDPFLGTAPTQCNTTFYLPTAVDKVEVTAAVSATLDSQPTNAAKATKKNGQPERFYSPEWAVTGSDGRAWIASAHVDVANGSSSHNRVQLTLRLPIKKAG